MRLVLQSVLLPNEVSQKQDIYYLASGSIEVMADEVKVQTNSIFSTKTYMNLFDGAVWVKYTNRNTFNLEIEIKGIAELEIHFWSATSEQLISKHTIEHLEMKKSSVQFTLNEDETIYFKIKAINDAWIKQMQYTLEATANELNDVHLSVVICTYKRNQQVMENIRKLKSSLFFRQTSDYYQKMSVRVVDNASELEESDEAYFKLIHNNNTGGSGGFARGILESRQDIQQHGISHVIFMDDDVEFINETFYRLYALLSLISRQYQDNPVAGRMFKVRQRETQYTASEIWNKGDLQHIGYNQDMSKGDKLQTMNKELGEYSGWWFACFPIEFVKKNLPLPFFLHCDDVEYGLRCGKKPLLMNGVQVWHETYEQRQDSTILYYDIRNAMIVNVIHGQCVTPKEVVKAFNRKMLYSFKAAKFAESYVMTVAFRDYLKGKTFFVGSQYKKIIARHNQLTSLILAMFGFGFIQIENIFKGNKAFESYKTILFEKTEGGNIT